MSSLGWSTLKRAARLGALTLGVALGVAAKSDPAVAQGWIEPIPGRVADWGVVKLRTEVHVRVVDRVAEIEVEEWFENRGGGIGEGDYVYPLPGEAVFSNFSLYQGDEELRGETMDAERARSIYEEIVRRQRDPALIELIGHGMVRARVFPFQPGETRRITMRWTQVLDRAGDALVFRYAAGSATPGSVVGVPVPMPRPMPERDARPGAPRRVSDVPLTFELVAEDGTRFRDPFSPTHELEVRRDDGRLRVRPEQSLSGDFALFLPLARGLVGMSLVTHRPSVAEDGYFMLTLSPGQPRSEDVTPRDVVAVVDVSGSMSGTKMRQTQDALRQLLGSLSPRDRFHLVAFSNRVSTYRADWTQATPDALAAARRWVDALTATGGTNISGALAEAFRLESAPDRLPIVVFLTDGLPTVEETNPEAIAARAERDRGRARVFTFGVGFDVNTYLLDRLSDAGRGATEYVTPEQDVEEAVARLAAKVQHPVLTDIRIDGAPVDLVELYPGELPDLFAGEELIVLGRYRARGTDARGDLRIRGSRAGGTERMTSAVTFPVHTSAHDYLPRLWASRKVGELMQQIRLNGLNQELVDEVRETALRYGILTEWTSHLVVEPGMVAMEGDVRLQSMAPLAPPPPSAASGQGAVQSA
ncbi:MAG TPA: VWA domain-containing protein, partial [Longimicrobiales bacterium]